LNNFLHLEFKLVNFVFRAIFLKTLILIQIIDYGLLRKVLKGASYWKLPVFVGQISHNAQLNIVCNKISTLWQPQHVHFSGFNKRRKTLPEVYEDSQLYICILNKIERISYSFNFLANYLKGLKIVMHEDIHG
jgi:hypothetical protein